MSNMLSDIRLLNVPLESNYKHTFYFSDATKQVNYFASRIVKGAVECSYQRKDNVIRYPACIDDIITCNYVMYKNESHSNKWYYAFIKKMEYKNDNMTEIFIETDVIQTWLFDYNIISAFIEREHVKSDIAGEHTIPEMLETGEFTCNQLLRDTSLQEYVYVVQATEDNEGTPLGATNFGGVWVSGGAYICESGTELNTFVNTYTENPDAITNVYLIPRKIINKTEGIMRYEGQAEPITYKYNFAKQLSLDGYTPRNKKLLTYPFNYILLSNNAGNSNIMQYENFSGDLCEFEIAGVPTVGGSIKCAPLKYKGLERMQQEGIMLGKFPACSWSKDIYTNWLTQNAVNIGLGVASGGLQLLGGIALMGTGAGALAGAGSVASGALAIGQTMGQVYQMSFTPTSAEGNINGGDINTCYKMNLFYFHKMSIKKEYAKSIDTYFDMFGYKVNRVGIPYKNHRENYWFTKTLEINIVGDLPMIDLQKIKECYNNGVTFWKTPANICNYNASNNIV